MELMLVDGYSRLNVFSITIKCQKKSILPWLLLHWKKKPLNGINGWRTIIDYLLRELSRKPLKSILGNPNMRIFRSNWLNYCKPLLWKIIKQNLKPFSNKVIRISDSILLSCFISGRKYYLKRELQIARPGDMMKVVSFTKLCEAKYAKQYSFSNTSFKQS